MILKYDCIYILLCKNGRYYVGSTINIERRFNEHCAGRVNSTKNLRPLKLVYSQEYGTIKEARLAECWLKQQKSRLLIEKIIRSGIIEKDFMGH